MHRNMQVFWVCWILRPPPGSFANPAVSDPVPFVHVRFYRL
jgi:hypothetical protein